MAELEAERWKPSCLPLPDAAHVQPVKGLLCCGNWGVNPYHRRGIWAFFANLWRVVLGAYLRSEFPSSERRLRRSMAECEAWCAAENKQEAATRAMTDRVCR